MKYRPLHPEELDNLRDDFVQFLAANSVTADDWKKVKAEQPAQAQQLIELFSDMVWEKVLKNIQYLEMRTPDEMRVLRFGGEKIMMVVIRIKHDGFDFTNAEHIQSIAEGSVDLLSFDPEVFKGARDYKAAKEMEVFVLMEQGARPCKEAFWQAVLGMLPPEDSVEK